MRIAFVPAARLLSETAPNGEALIASSLIRALAARGHEILAYCERSELPSIPGVEVREIAAHGATVGLGRLAFARRIARDAARERYDVAHLLFPFTTADGYTFANGAPLVCGPVNLPWPGGAARVPRLAARLAGSVTDRLERRAHALTLARAARLLVTGRSSLDALPADARDRCVDVPFGVDAEVFRPRPFPDEPTIMFLSVLQRRKGVEVLVRAMPYVLRRVPRARLVIAGDDPHGLRPALEALARELGVADAVRFTGAVPVAGAATVFARATVVAQPSLGEPFGMTVIEAMACGRPVVGTASGGIPDAIVDRRGGRLVPPGDERLLADALCRVLEQQGEAEALGAFNRRLVEERYALDVVVDRIEETYAAVTGSRTEGVRVA